MWQLTPPHVDPSLVLWTKHGMASLYLSTPKDKLLRSPFVIKLLLHSPHSFLTFRSPGDFYGDYVFCLFTELFYLEVILFSYGPKKRKQECLRFQS